MTRATATERGILVIVSSPSGAGKTTLTRRLLGEFDNLGFSVSYTTRPMRPGEIDGSDYHFVTPAVFEDMVANHDFAEHAFVHGNRYGTARAPIEAALATGRDLIFDVDWQGGAALSEQWRSDALKIFILPPDLDALAERLRRRATDAPDVIERRLRKAIEELQHFDEYQYLIVNDDVDYAYKVLRALYLTRRYGRVTTAAHSFPLTDLAKLVDTNEASGAIDHARKLVGQRQS
jgi:guanylate kinase